MCNMLNVTAETVFKAQADLAAAESQLDSLKFDDPQPGIGHQDAVDRAERSIQPQRDLVAEMQETVGGKVFLIPEQNVTLLSDKIAKLNKRANKLSVDPVVITLHDTVEKNHGTKVKPEWVVFQYIAVKGTTPKLAGWQFAATLEHDENGVIVRRLPDLDASVDLTHYRKADPTNCDQCHQRRRRVDTYIVLHEYGTLKQVGSSCLKDFLGGQSPERIAAWCSYLADFMDDLESTDSEFYGGSAPSRTGTVEYLTHVACMIRNYGWTSKGTAYNFGGEATASAADNNIFNMSRNKTDRDGQPMFIVPLVEDESLALASIAHVRALSEDDLANDYVYNLFTSLKGESIPTRQYGIAASAISFFRKETEKKLKAEKTAASEYIGEVGQKKFTTEVTITKVVELEPYTYGASPGALYLMQDATGNVIKWNSSKQVEGMDQGVTGTICGTIKAHDDGTGKYGDKNYGKSTVLTRCKFTEA